MSLQEWGKWSLLIELKPRTELASLFVDCPPPVLSLSAASDAQLSRDLTTNERSDEPSEALIGCATQSHDLKQLLIISSHIIKLESKYKSSSHMDNTDNSANSGSEFVQIAKFGDLYFKPDSVHALTWTDSHRLLMCKVGVEVIDCPLVTKTFHRLAIDLSKKLLLDEYVENTQSHDLSVECTNCSQSLIADKIRKLNLIALPEDNWLDTSQSIEYYCGNTCGCSHSEKHLASLCSDATSNSARNDWLPLKERVVISDSFLFVDKAIVPSSAVLCDEESNVVRCVKCMDELGKVLKKHFDVLQFHHAVCSLRSKNNFDSYIKTRFGDMERFFAWMLLCQCESQTSLKLVFRTYDKRPYFLVWLLESYVVMSSGKLKRVAEVDLDRVDNVFSFPALKMLYKMFDSETARTDPRANGEDASVGLVDLPLPCCLKILEVLLKSSLVLPPAGRSVGQFYVGFLKLKNRMNG